MSIAAVKIALEKQVKAISGTMSTGWENTSYSPPVDGSAYQLIHLLPATPDNPTFGTKFYREVGLMQITLSYPLDGGAGKAYAKAEAIRAGFTRGDSFTQAGVTVIIAATPTVGPGMNQADRYVLPVRIRYFANILA